MFRVRRHLHRVASRPTCGGETFGSSPTSDGGRCCSAERCVCSTCIFRRSQDSRGDSYADRAAQAADKEWWELNTILYNLVDKSIDWVTGNVDPEDDKAKVLMLMASDGSWGDGVGYLELLKPYHDVTSVDKQTSLRNDIAALKVDADMGYEDFYEFATKLSENWELIEGKLTRYSSRSIIIKSCYG